MLRENLAANRTRLFESTRRTTGARSIWQVRRNKQAQTEYCISAGSELRRLRGAMQESPRERVFHSIAGKPSVGSSLLPTRRNKILRESNFAEKSKFSPSNSFCAVPTDSGGTPRDASTRGGKEERGGGEEGIESTRRGPISKAGRLILPEEAPHFGHRRW